MPSASRRFLAEVVPMNAGLPEFHAKACFDDEKAPPTERPYQAGESPMPQGRRTTGSQTRYAFQASAIRTRPLRRRAEAFGTAGFLKSVPNRPSQQVQRQPACGDPFSWFVLPLWVNNPHRKPTEPLGLSVQDAGMETPLPGRTGGGRDTGNKWSLAAESLLFYIISMG